MTTSNPSHSVLLSLALNANPPNLHNLEQLIRAQHRLPLIFTNRSNVEDSSYYCTFDAGAPSSLPSYQKRARLAFTLLDAHYPLADIDMNSFACLLPFADEAHQDVAFTLFKNHLDDHKLNLENALEMAHYVVKAGNHPMAKYLFDEFLPKKMKRDIVLSFSRNPLVTAIYSGDEDMVQYLYQHQCLESFHSPSHPYLFYAALSRQTSITQWLAEQGEDINAKVDRDFNKNVGLITRLSMDQRQNEDFNLVKTLLDLGVNPNDSTKGSINALSGFILVVKESEVAQSHQIIDLLLKAGTNPNHSGLEQRTPFIDAARCNDVKIMAKLLQYGADMEATDEHGNTALMYAAEFKRTLSFDFLIENGANFNVINRHGRGLVDVAHEDMMGPVMAVFSAQEKQKLHSETTPAQGLPHRYRM